MDQVVARLDRDYRMSIEAQAEGEEELHEVVHIHELSPYTMLLASVALCTGIVVHSYASHHDVALDLAEIRVSYHQQGSGTQYEEWIQESLRLEGDLSEAEHRRLAHVGHQCSIRKMLESGIEIRTETIV